MERIELELDEQTMQRARRLAETRRCTLEQLLTEIIERLGPGTTTDDVFQGMFAQEPELIDDVVESAMHARETDPLRHNGG
jgi:hypothetical protein